jgi:hypothetical protein
MRGTPAGTSEEKENKSNYIYQDSRWQYHNKVASVLLSRPSGKTYNKVLLDHVGDETRRHFQEFMDSAPPPPLQGRKYTGATRVV